MAKKKKNKLVEQAKKYKDEGRSMKTLEADREAAETQELVDAATAVFETYFDEVLPMLMEQGIEYEVQMKSPPHERKGYMVHFTNTKLKGEGIEVSGVIMDFKPSHDGEPAWRYEFTPDHATGKMAYAQWPLEQFVVWMAEIFFSEEMKGE